MYYSNKLVTYDVVERMGHASRNSWTTPRADIYKNTCWERPQSPRNYYLWFFFSKKIIVWRQSLRKEKKYRSQFQQDPSKSLLYPSSSLFVVVVPLSSVKEMLFRETTQKRGKNAFQRRCICQKIFFWPVADDDAPAPAHHHLCWQHQLASWNSVRHCHSGV